jgi:O-antigen/teichoic acid export membrane protein
MSSGKSIVGGGLKLGGNQAFVQVCSFARSVIVARLISPANFGVAATFAMTFSFLEMISNLAAETVIIQAKDGNEPAFQQTAQVVQFLRGLANALFIFALAGVISRLFGVPQAKPAFQCLALLPLLRGVTNLDVNRLQRDLKFGPSILADSGSNLLVTIIALPLGLWLRDYWAMLWLLILQSAAYVTGSHLVAVRRYSWGWSKVYARTILSFGWPLVINGLLLYIILQGDRFVIGAARRLFTHSSYTLADLGVYSVAFALTFAPTMLVANISTSLFLPLLSRAQADGFQFEKRYVACFQFVSLMASVISILFIVSGGWLIRMIYGQKYAAAGAFVGVLAAMQAMRILRVAPTLAAMAHADTKNAMFSNIVRTLALAGVLFAGITGRSLTWVAASGFAGEVLAFLTCIWRLQRCHSVSAKLSVRPLALSASAMLLGATLAAAGISNLGWAAAPLAAGGLMIMMLILALFLFDGLRGDLRAIAREKRFLPGWKRPVLTQNPEVAPMTGDSASATSR